jgi:hypothetical protein
MKSWWSGKVLWKRATSIKACRYFRQIETGDNRQKNVRHSLMPLHEHAHACRYFPQIETEDAADRKMFRGKPNGIISTDILKRMYILFEIFARNLIFQQVCHH